MNKPTDPQAAKARAEAAFKPRPLLAAARDGRSAAEAAQAAEAEKTARLRELRLAKERSDRIAIEVRRARREMRRP